jgi:hypothetical protein
MFIRGGKGVRIAIIYVLPDILSLLCGSFAFSEQFLAFYLSSSPSVMAITPQGWTNIPDAEAKINLRDKNVPWYDPKLKKLGPLARELLENYSKILPAEVEDHIYKMVSFVLNLIGRS